MDVSADELLAVPITGNLVDLEHLNQALGALRSRVLERQREVTAELDKRRAIIEQRRLAAAAEAGQVNRPPSQDVFGGAPAAAIAQAPEQVTPDG